MMSKLAEECEEFREALNLLLIAMIDVDLNRGVQLTELERKARDNARRCFDEWDDSSSNYKGEL